MRTKRLETITNMLETQGNVEVAELSVLLKVTEKTIRQDLTLLEKTGLAVRVHGGATLPSRMSDIYPIPSRKQKHMDEKKEIANKAISLIEDGDIIILDAGSTTQEVAKLLDKQVIVITNDPIISHTLLYNEKITLFSTGGKLRREFGCTYTGRDAVRMLNNYHANKCFIGTSAFDTEQGLMVFSSEEGEVKSAIMHASSQTICLADYSKFNKTAFFTFAAPSEIDIIITDNRIPAQELQDLQAAGLCILTPDIKKD